MPNNRTFSFFGVTVAVKITFAKKTKEFKSSSESRTFPSHVEIIKKYAAIFSCFFILMRNFISHPKGKTCRLRKFENKA
jgi:amino acid permease